MQKTIMMLVLTFLYRKYHFWEDLVEKIKSITLRLNLVARLIRICRTQC